MSRWTWHHHRFEGVVFWTLILIDLLLDTYNDNRMLLFVKPSNIYNTFHLNIWGKKICVYQKCIVILVIILFHYRSHNYTYCCKCLYKKLHEEIIYIGEILIEAKSIIFYKSMYSFKSSKDWKAYLDQENWAYFCMTKFLL